MADVHHVREDVALECGKDFVGRDGLRGRRLAQERAEDGGIAFGSYWLFGQMGEMVGDQVDYAVA
jgi:hypothetical protein